jgi:SAM-dependent methyltransferase
MRNRTPAYDEDLAFVHDVGFGGFANGAAPELLKILRQAGINEGLVVDLGCGSGIWARYLSEAGYRVLGVDLSPAMIALARRQAPDAQFQVESFLKFPLPACRAITALGEVLAYQFDSANSGRSLQQWFRRAHRALEPGGMLIFDMAEVGLDQDRAPTFREGPGWACLIRFEYDTKREQLIRHIGTFRQVGKWYRRHEETHHVQLYRRQEIASMLRRAGFRVRSARCHGSYRLLPGRVGFVARKKV